MNVLDTKNPLYFTARPNTKKVLYKLRPVFNETFGHLRSPSRIKEFRGFAPEGNVQTEDLCDLLDKLKFLRGFIKQEYYEGGVENYYANFLKIVKSFGVANCFEYAVIAKTILRLNKIKNVDIFSVQVKDAKGNIKDFDHAVVALGVSKSKNNKKTKQVFKPSKNTLIVDLWWPFGTICKLKNVRKKYRIMGLKDSDEIMFKPVKIPEPNTKSLNNVTEQLPQLKFN